MRTVCALIVGLVTTLAAPGAAQLDQSIDLGAAMRVQIDLEDGAAVLRVRGRGRPVVQPLPSETIEGATARRVTLSGGEGVLVAEIPDRAVALVVARGRRPEVLWVGQLTPHGDPGEQRRDVLQIADRTGDGVDDVVVGYVQQGRTICGEEMTLLEPQAIDPGALRLRSVSLRNLGAANEVEVVASTDPPEGIQNGGEAPLLELLQARGASSAAGRSDPPLPVALVDGDPETAWTEAAAGPGRWEFATLRVTDPGLAIRALRLVPRTAEAERGTPATFYIQGSAGPRLAVRIPREPTVGEVWWVSLPEPMRWTCASVVLNEPFDEPAHVGLAELTAFSEVDFGGGVDALVRRLASGGEEGARSARALRSLGPSVLETLEAGWAEMTPVERRLVLQVAAAHPDDARAQALFVSAAADADESVREATLAQAGAIPANDLLRALVAADGAAARATADGAALVLARRAPEEVAVITQTLAREGSEDRAILRRALRTAAVRGDESVRAAIRGWIESAPPAARAAAALALTGDEEATAALAALALEAAPQAEAFPTRWRFATAAGALPTASEAVRDWLVAQATEADEWMMRAAAVGALARMGAPRAGAVARRALEDEYPRVRVTAVEALAGNAEHAEALGALARRDRWPMVRAAAIEALGPVAPARPLVRRAIHDRHELVRAAAIRALIRAEDWDAWEAVEDRLAAEKEWPVVLQAAVAYARARCREDAVDVLGQVIDRAQRPNPWQPDVEVAARAVEALAAIGGEEAAERIRRAGSDLSPQMIRIAAEAAAHVPSCH